MIETSEQFDKLSAALAAAQAEFPLVERNRRVKVAPKESPAYEFWYATLGEIRKVVTPPLTAHGISVQTFPQVTYADLDNDNCHADVSVTTRLVLGDQWIQATIPLITSKVNPQGIGSALTYARRYSLEIVCGVEAADDDDGNAACGNEVQESDTKRQPAKTNGKARPKEESKHEPSGAVGDVPTNDELNFITEHQQLIPDLHDSKSYAACRDAIKKQRPVVQRILSPAMLAQKALIEEEEREAKQRQEATV